MASPFCFLAATLAALRPIHTGVTAAPRRLGVAASRDTARERTGATAKLSRLASPATPTAAVDADIFPCFRTDQTAARASTVARRRCGALSSRRCAFRSRVPSATTIDVARRSPPARASAALGEARRRHADPRRAMTTSSSAFALALCAPPRARHSASHPPGLPARVPRGGGGGRRVAAVSWTCAATGGASGRGGGPRSGFPSRGRGPGRGRDALAAAALPEAASARATPPGHLPRAAIRAPRRPPRGTPAVRRARGSTPARAAPAPGNAPPPPPRSRRDLPRRGRRQGPRSPRSLPRRFPTRLLRRLLPAPVPASLRRRPHQQVLQRLHVPSRGGSTRGRREGVGQRRPRGRLALGSSRGTSSLSTAAPCDGRRSR